MWIRAMMPAEASASKLEIKKPPGGIKFLLGALVALEEPGRLEGILFWPGTNPDTGWSCSYAAEIWSAAERQSSTSPDHRLKRPPKNSVFNCREVADVLLRHDSHAVFDRLFRSHENRRARHDFFHLGLPRGLSLQDDFSGIVALGNQANQFPLGHDHQRSYMLTRHHFYCVVDTPVRRNVPNVLAFFVSRLNEPYRPGP